MISINETITMQNLFKFCDNHNYAVFEKKAGSSNGMLFEIDNKYVCNVRFVDVLPGDESDYVVFEVYPGVNAVSAYYPMIANYCQMIHAGVGVVQADCERGDVFFKMELPITDKPVSCEAIDTVVSSAVNILDVHTPALDALANGYVADTADTDLVTRITQPVESMNEQAARESIHCYFEELSGHNSVSYDEDNCRWMCEILTGNNAYNLRADYVGNMMRIRIGYGVKSASVDNAYRRMTSTYLTKESASRKVGTLILDEENRVCAQTYVSLCEGPVSKDTMDHLEGILVSTLSSLETSIAQITHGIIPMNHEKDSDKRSRFKSMLDSMMGHNGDGGPRPGGLLGSLFGSHSDDDDDDDDDDDEDNIPDSFLEELFSSHSDDDDDNHSGEYSEYISGIHPDDIDDVDFSEDDDDEDD